MARGMAANHRRQCHARYYQRYRTEISLRGEKWTEEKVMSEANEVKEDYAERFLKEHGYDWDYSPIGCCVDRDPCSQCVAWAAEHPDSREIENP